MTRLTDTLAFGPGLDIAARSCASISPLHALENQDNLLVIDANGRAAFLRDQVACTVHLDGWPRGHVRVAVLDGMGGHGQGRQAAESVAAGLLEVPACATLAPLCAHLDALHAKLQAHFRRPGDDDSARRPGTTLTLLEIPPGQAPLLYHVGDSRLYEITPQAATPLTIDHVPATAYAMRGLLGAQEWWQQVHGEHRAQISQAFILGNAFANPQQLDNALYRLDADNLPAFLRALPDRRVLTVRHDAVYLLATDGFWACGRPQDWTACWPALLAPAGQKHSARRLLDRLYEAFAHAPPPDLHIDNLSAAVLRFPAPVKKDGRNGNIEETALPNAVFTPLF
jgi:serine/threonine protein phosphatase PrpC